MRTRNSIQFEILIMDAIKYDDYKGLFYTNNIAGIFNELKRIISRYEQKYIRKQEILGVDIRKPEEINLFFRNGSHISITGRKNFAGQKFSGAIIEETLTISQEQLQEIRSRLNKKK